AARQDRCVCKAVVGGAFTEGTPTVPRYLGLLRNWPCGGMRRPAAGHRCTSGCGAGGKPVSWFVRHAVPAGTAFPAAAMSEIALRFDPQPANAALPKMHAQAACST